MDVRVIIEMMDIRDDDDSNGDHEKNDLKCETENCTKKSKSYWEKKNYEFSYKERRELVAEVLAIICKLIMNNQVYIFAGKILLQEGKGCIGDRAIGATALLVMIWWARKLKGRLNELNIINELLKIYVDDVNGVYHSIKAGSEYKNGKLEFSETKEEEDKNIPDDKRTMKIVRAVANVINPMISMTIDVPSEYADEKVPMLDVKAWIEEKENQQIYYTFYEKPTKNRYVISKSSVMPISNIIETMSQEVF